jgi:hypothetical protein
VADSSRAGPGSLLRCGTERMICTEASMSTTGLTLVSGGTTASNADTVLTLSGAGIATDEVMLIDGERMLTVDVTGSVVTVRRAWDGSVLTAHSPGATVYALRTLWVDRGALGSTAAAHNSGDALVMHVFPGPVVNFTVGLALAEMGLEQSGYKVVSTRGGHNETRASVDMSDAAARVFSRYGRKSRLRAV